MTTPIESLTGYSSFLITDRQDLICFYRTGQEIAIYYKADERLELKLAEHVPPFLRACRSAIELLGSFQNISAAASNLPLLKHWSVPSVLEPLQAENAKLKKALQVADAALDVKTKPKGEE